MLVGLRLGDYERAALRWRRGEDGEKDGVVLLRLLEALGNVQNETVNDGFRRSASALEVWAERRGNASVFDFGESFNWKKKTPFVE